MEDILRSMGSQRNHSQDGNRTTLVGWGVGTDVLFPEALLDVGSLSVLPLDLAYQRENTFDLI